MHPRQVLGEIQNRFVMRAVYELGYSTVGYDRDHEPIPRLLNITALGYTRLHLMRYVYSKWSCERYRSHKFPAKFNLMFDFRRQCANIFREITRNVDVLFSHYHLKRIDQVQTCLEPVRIG